MTRTRWAAGPRTGRTREPVGDTGPVVEPGTGRIPEPVQVAPPVGGWAETAPAAGRCVPQTQSGYPWFVDISGSTPSERESSAADRSVDAAAPGPDVQQGGTQEGVSAVNPGRASGALFGALALYTLLRLALVAVLTAVLAIFMPLIVALLFAIVVQLPLAWWLFGGPRARVNDAIAQASARRRAERGRLQAGLTGDLSD